MMNREEALRGLKRIETLSCGFGMADAESLCEVKRIVFCLRCGPLQDLYFREKLAEIESWSVVGFSARKFAQHIGGASGVQAFAQGALWTATSLVEERWPA